MSSAPKSEGARAQEAEWAARKAERMDICQACPNAMAGRTRKYLCGLCGCVIAAKVRLPGAKCPAGKW